MMAKLSSPFIMQLYGYHINQADKAYYLFMEYIIRGPLHRLLRDQDVQTGAKLVPDEEFCWFHRWQIAWDILEGLIYLHRLKLLHRDLKSSSILLSGDQIRAKISDFGLARINTF